MKQVKIYLKPIVYNIKSSIQLFNFINCCKINLMHRIISIILFAKLIASPLFSFGQKRVYFENTKIEGLGLNFGNFGVGEVSLEQCIFPEIWDNSDYDYAGVDFIFSGYYTTVISENGSNVVEGEIKLIRTKDGNVNKIKEILVFNVKKGLIFGKVSYKRYTLEDIFEDSDPEILKGNWVEESSITAIASNIQSGERLYKNIKFIENTSDTNGKLITYSIQQKSGPVISLNYFKSLIVLNSLKLDEKPIVKKQ